MSTNGIHTQHTWQVRRATGRLTLEGAHETPAEIVSGQDDTWVATLDACLATIAPRWFVDWVAVLEPSGSAAVDVASVHLRRPGADAEVVDMCASWHAGAGLAARRRYAAVAALLRTVSAEVRTFGYVDPASGRRGCAGRLVAVWTTDAPVALDLSSAADVLLVQLCARVMLHDGTTVDGRPGEGAERALERLLAALGLGHLDPTSDGEATRTFLLALARAGLAGTALDLDAAYTSAA
jgi:hypothetical protein